MKKITLINHTLAVLALCAISSCAVKDLPQRAENRSVPSAYTSATDTVNMSRNSWRNFFADKNLIALIDTALVRNQELQIVGREIEITRNEIRAAKGELLPYIGIGAAAGPDKSGKYTWNGQSERDWEAAERSPAYKGDFLLQANFNWEADIWKKLRNNKKAAVARYLASVEGKNFLVTRLIAEIAGAYYELIALDNQLNIIRQSVEIQENVLNVIRQQKDAARVTQLAVNRFNAQLLNTKNRMYAMQQERTEVENLINLLAGRFPSPVPRDPNALYTTVFDTTAVGIPLQLLENRPDIRQAELELTAARLDVKAVKAKFLPALGISASVGYQAFNPSVWLNPASLLYSAAGELIGPLVNRNAIMAEYRSANARQQQAVLQYEQTLLNAFIEVKNQLAGMQNYSNSYNTKKGEVELLTQSISISGNLFASARADYGEVLFTQREALEAQMELVETKMKQLGAEINVYRALGGGWR